MEPHEPVVVGILNVTPDSFSDGGRWPTLEAQVAAGERLAAEGADYVEVGGESTRPGAQPVPLEEELRRVIPVVRELKRRLRVPIAVDTSKAEVARSALQEGVSLINDVTALRGDPAMADVLADSEALVVLMHMRGTPRTMQQAPRYKDVVGEIIEFFRERMEFAEARGIRRERVILDPGIGFGKLVSHNLEILKDLHRFEALGRPLMVGVSRKSFIGAVTGRPVTEREIGTAVANVFALLGGASYLRVHDVKAARDTISLVKAIREASRVYDGVGSHGRVH